MRILYIDIDSQRPDHLGCYGYHRHTSPNIDRIAAQGVRYENYYVSDAPCLPSRTALWSGRFGIHNGVINHGGQASEMFNEGIERGFESTLGQTGWMRCLRDCGLKTATISPFGERHSAWHWYANFNEVYNTGKRGMENADEVAPVAIDWLKRHGRNDKWFLHVNLWDPHTPYRVPASFGDPFKDEPLPAWLTEEIREQHWLGCGPHAAQEVNGYDDVTTTFDGDFPRQPVRIDSMDEVRRMFDGYDTGVLFADKHIGHMLNSLADLNILDETMIVITADHGEALGEFNIYGDHQMADHVTNRVPLIVKAPGVTLAETGQVNHDLHYHVDFAAATIDYCGGKVRNNWDGQSLLTGEGRFSGTGGSPGKSKQSHNASRDHLVLSQGAWSCQRTVRFNHDGGQYQCIRSYHDGHHGFPDVMLFDIANDPHGLHDLAGERSDIVKHALSLLDQWLADMMRSATHAIDPMWTVMREGGPLHARGQLPAYIKRLRATGRSRCADVLSKMHADEL